MQPESVKNQRLAPDPPGDLIQPLKDALDVEIAKAPIRTDNAKDARRLTIMGDKDIPYSLLKKVMTTGARAGYSDVSFAVRQKYEP